MNAASMPGKHIADLAEVDVAHGRSSILAGHVMLDQDRSFEDHHLGLMRENPDEHLLAADVGRDDDLVFDLTLAATPRGLQARAIGTGPTISAPRLALWADRERSRFFSGGRPTSVTRRTSTLWPPTRTDFLSSVTSDDPRRMTSGSFLRNHAIYQSSYFFWSDLRPWEGVPGAHRHGGAK